MPAGSAAVVARKREQRRQEQAEAKAARATEKTAKIEAWFAAHDTDSNGSLDIAQFKSLLSSLYPGAPLNESTVNMLVDKCGGTISKQNVIAAVNKYGAYAKDAAAFDELFAIFDKDGSGALSPPELLALLRECARTDPKIPIEEVDADDVSMVVNAADKDQSGTIDKAELLPALAQWKEDMSATDWQAQRKAASKSSACSLL